LYVLLKGLNFPNSPGSVLKLGMFIPFWGLAYDNRSILSTNFYVNPENKIKNQQSLEDGSKIHFQNLIYTTLNIPQSIHKYTFGAANEKLPNFQSDGQVRL
jgi:hypothetical protein